MSSRDVLLTAGRYLLASLVGLFAQVIITVLLVLLVPGEAPDMFGAFFLIGKIIAWLLLNALPVSLVAEALLTPQSGFLRRGISDDGLRLLLRQFRAVRGMGRVKCVPRQYGGAARDFGRVRALRPRRCPVRFGFLVGASVRKTAMARSVACWSSQ